MNSENSELTYAHGYFFNNYYVLLSLLFVVMNCGCVIKSVSLSVSRVLSPVSPSHTQTTHTHAHSLRAVGRDVSQAYATLPGFDPRWEIMLSHYVRLSLFVFFFSPDNSRFVDAYEG